MNKKFLSAILFGALMVTSTGTFVSCKDYEDDIKDVQEQVNANKSECAAAIKALQDQAAALQTALNAAKAEATKYADDAAKKAAASAKEEAIAAALEKVNDLKAWVESQNYVTEEALAEALLPISAKIAAIETGLDEIWVYINETLTAADQASLKAIMTLQEDLAIQQATLDKYAANLEELGDADAELWAELASAREELQQAISAVNVLLEDETGALWAELASTREGLQEAITALTNIQADDKAELLAEIDEILKANLKTSETLSALINTQAEDKAELKNEIEQILIENAKLSETLSALISTHAEDTAELWAELASAREGLQEAFTTLNNKMDAEDEKLWAEINELVQQNLTTSEAIAALINVQADDKAELEEKINAAKDELNKLISSEIEALHATNAGMKDEMTKIWETLEDEKNEINALINNNAANIQAIGDHLLSLHVLVKGYLTSMVFAPSYYVDGIEAIPFMTLKYQPWTNLGTAKEGQEGAEVTLSDGTTEASYYVSPSYIDVESIESFNVLLNDAINMNSRAADDVTATIKSFENGKLTVNLKKNSSKKFGGEGNKFKVMALQANVNRGNLNPYAKIRPTEIYTVTSDWARIYEGHYLPQIHAVNEEAENIHLWSYNEAIAAKEGELILATSDYMTPINLNELVSTCLRDLPIEDDKIAYTLLNEEQMEAYGLKFEFNLLDEYMLKVGQSVEETNQEKFATITEVEKVIDDVKYIEYIMSSCAMNGTPNNADAIGREPLVQVVLKDEVNGKFVDVNYFKVKWTAVTNEIERGTIEIFDNPENLFACTTDYTFKVGTEKMNEFFYTYLNKSKEEFHLIYKPEVDASEDADGESFILYSDAKCTKVVENAGTVKQILAEGSTTTYNLVWDYTTGEITAEEWAAKKVERTVYMKYVNQANPAETITFSMTFVLYIEDMALAAGYVQTYWSGELTTTNIGKMFQVNPALTDDLNYGKKKFETCRLITNLLHGYNVAGIDADKLTIKDIVSENVEGAKFVFDINRIKMTWTAQWTVSEDGTQLLYEGVPAAEITHYDGKVPYIKLYETDNFNVATEGAKELVGKKVPVQIVGTHCSGHTTVLDSYLVHFIDPLAATFNMKNGELKDLLTGGSSLDIRTAISVKEKFGLYRDVIFENEDGSLGKNQELIDWYAVEPAIWDIDNAKTNLSVVDNHLVITDEFNTLFSTHRDKYQLDVETSSLGNPKNLIFKNFSGTHIQQAFKVRIPVYVKTKWNSMLTDEPNYIEVTIVPGQYDE